MQGVLDHRLSADVEGMVNTIVSSDPDLLNVAPLSTTYTMLKVDGGAMEVIVRNPIGERTEGRVRGYFAHNLFLAQNGLNGDFCWCHS